MILDSSAVIAIVRKEPEQAEFASLIEQDPSPRMSAASLLECLLRHAGQTLSRDQLLDQAWPFNVAVTPNAVDAYIHYLRTKLGAAGGWIETVRGVGYRLRDG